jgi:uncharacterized protein DUF6011
MGMQAFQTIEEAKAFTLAGNATITLESLRTGAHFTYKVRQATDKETGEPTPGTYFVSLLNGHDNENDYCYLGMIRQGRFGLTKASRAGAEALSVKAFSFFFGSTELHPELVVHHEGRCGRCGRTLTVPESLDSGLGPDCRAEMGLV